MELASTDLKKSRLELLQSSHFLVSEALAGDASTGIELSLMMASLRSRPAPPTYEQYSMLFIGPVEPLLPQGTYRFRHDQIGELSLFMVPVGCDAEGAQYEVCVSRKTTDD
jgi:hypothetical protein